MRFGSATPSRVGIPANTDANFPDLPGTYTSPDGAIVLPGGALDPWWNYRAGNGPARGEIVVIGDSTTYGSGGNYSWLQRLRDRAVSSGLPDGGKGMFAGGEQFIAYDSPEVNGFVSTTFSGGAPDAYDNTDGQYYYDASGAPGHTTVLQFRSTAARLWYSFRGDAGDFTYSVDSGAPVTVHANNLSGTINRFAYISGLTANTTHTITITNTSGAACHVALAPVNATGVSVQKFATSGDEWSLRMYRGGAEASPPWMSPSDGNRWQSPFGLLPTDPPSPTYRGAARDTSHDGDGGRIHPVLGIFDLGFNDLTNATGSFDLGMWTEVVKIAAATCADAGCACLILSGQLPYNANWTTYGAARFNAMKAQAAASGVAFMDIFYPVAGPSLSYTSGPTNPHLFKAQYQAQADYLWDNLLGL